jgi:hypothetical protein
MLLMNVFISRWNYSIRHAEKQRFGMRLFISNYEQRMIRNEVNHFHERGNTVTYTRKESSDITKIYDPKFKINSFILTNVIFHLMICIFC